MNFLKVELLEIIKWVKNQNISSKLLLIVLLLRPIADIKPINIIGVLTPIVIILSFLLSSKKIVLKQLDKLLVLYGAAVLLNTFFLLFNKPFPLIQSISVIISLFPIIFFIYRFTLRTDEDHERVVQLITLSMLIPLLIITYEMLLGPINIYTPGGRGLTRYRGPYKNGESYTVYWMIAIISSVYLFLKAKPEKRKYYFYLSSIIIVIILAGLLYLSQLAAYLCFIAIMPVVLYYFYKWNKKYTIIFAVFIILFSVYHYHDTVETRLYRLIRADVEAVKGNIDSGVIGNNRVNIFIKYFNQYWDQNIPAKIFGAAFSKGYKHFALTWGPHNDFLRILIVSGALGFIIYIMIYLKLFTLIPSFESPERFLLITALITLTISSFAFVTTGAYLSMYFYPLVFALASFKSKS